MPIYDFEGNTLSSALDIQGNMLSNVYDVYGNPILAKTLKVMTYNTQWFNGINSQQAMQELIINNNNPHIIGFQEFSRNGQIGNVAETALLNYRYRQMSNHYNYLFMASKLPLSNIEIADFVHQSGETRAYMKCEINVYGKNITWINTHIDYISNVNQYAQMQEIFEMAEQAEYCIITGDFNSDALSTSDSDYINLYKPFVDAGYNLANSTAERGFTKTWTDSATATSPSEMTTATDNIITSENITIDSVVFDTTKFSYLNGQPIDHIPIIANLTIN